MPTIKKIVYAFFTLFFSANAYAASLPTLLLVHGALFTSAGWFEVQSHLQNAGYNVVTLDVPGRADDGIPANDVTLSLAAEKVCNVANLQKTPVILVGHSQGGAVITQALDKCSDKIKGLVYVTAVMPLNGETGIDDLSDTDKANFDKNVRFDEARNILQLNYKGPIKETFMHDATSDQFTRALHTMVSEPASIGVDKLNYPEKIFQSMPKFYIEATEDKIISLTTQKKIQAKASFRKIYTLHSSHSPMVSQSKQLANHLMDVVKNT